VEPSDQAQNAPYNDAPRSGEPMHETGRLGDSDDWLRFIVRNFSAVVMVVDPDDTLGYASPAFERILGYDRGEASGKNLFDFVHPDDLPRVQQESERIISGGDPGGNKAVEYRFCHKDGSWRWMEGEVASRQDDPAVRGIVLNARDITERKEAEERYRTLVEHIPVVAYIDRADGTDTPLYTSPQIEGLLGYKQEEGSRGRLWSERLHPEDRERVLAADKRFEKEGEERFSEEYRLLTKDDSVVWVLEDAVLIKDATTGSPLYWQGILYDITERKEAEEWLEHRAFHDLLTDLPNRQLLLDRLGHALARTTTNVVDAPKDLVGWLQHHPYLKTSKPQPVTLGGVKGEQLEVLVDHLPKDPNGYCDPYPSDCLDIFNQSSGDQIGYFREVNKRRVIVLGDVKGDTVVIWFAGPPDTFDKFAPKAQKVVDSVTWNGS
jgi:PAS domain S-box-containing protein